MKRIVVGSTVVLIAIAAVVLTALADQPATPQNVQGAWIDEPDAPTNYTRVNWDLVPGATGYNVFRYNSDSNLWELIAPSVPERFFRDYEPGTLPAYYSVSAVGPDGESAASATVTAQIDTPLGYIIHYPGEWPNGSLTPTNALIWWETPWMVGVDGMLEFGTSLTNMAPVLFDSFYAHGHGLHLTNLTPTTTYYYRITSVGPNRAGLALIRTMTTLDTNHPPVGTDITFGPITYGYPENIILSGSDPDSLGWVMFTFRIVTQPTNGTVSPAIINSYDLQASVFYTPNPGARGGDSFQFVINDTQLDSAPATITITNIFLNRDPVLTLTSTNTPEDMPLTLPLGVLATDPDGDAYTIYLNDVENGSAFIEEETNLVFTPPPNFHGIATVSIQVVDDYGGWTNGTFSITVDSVNDRPTAESDSLGVLEDYSTSIFLYGSDPDNDPVTFAVVDGPAHGTLSGTAPNLVYTPAENYFGDDSFTFVAQDGQTSSVPATVTITVFSLDDPPVATPASVTLPEDTSTNIVLTATDVEGDELWFMVVADPEHGTLSGDAPNLVYTPAANYFGEDSFYFEAFDGWAWGDAAQVTITVTPVSDAPEANPVTVTLAEDTSANVVLTGMDVDGDALTFTVVTGPAHGTLSGTAPNLVYTPAANYFGGDGFTFTVNDGQTTSAAATVAITVTSVNDAPVATPGSITTAEDTSANVILSGTDVEGSALTFAVVSGPAHGTLSGTAPNLVYTPAANFFGGDSFTFTVNDGQTTSTAATVAITVTSVNDAPVATPGSVTTAEDTSANIVLSGTDVDGDTLSFMVVSSPAHGTLSGTAPNLVYTPAANYFGGDSFTFTANDSQATSASATVTITVTAVNDAPVATPGSTTTAEDTSANIVVSGTDVDGDTLTFAVVSGPTHGTLSGTAPDLVYAPAANYFGGDSFTFTASDGQATSASSTVTITVTAVNDAPVATPGSITTAEDTSANVVLSGTDVDGDTLTFAVVSGPAHGTLSGTAPNLVYTPAANYFGGDSFTFTANDGQATSASATVTITVTAVNDAPVAQAQSVSTPYNTPGAITLTGTDIEGSALSYVVLSQPAHGTLTGTAPNLTFTPNIGFSGADSFTFKVNDGSLNSASATVTITVQAATSVPNAPSGLTAAAVSSSQINLAWTDNSNNEDGFKIERSTNGSTWTQIATVGPNAGTYASTGLSANKTYYYRVRAYNVLGNSGYSNTASAKTLH